MSTPTSLCCYSNHLTNEITLLLHSIHQSIRSNHINHYIRDLTIRIHRCMIQITFTIAFIQVTFTDQSFRSTQSQLYSSSNYLHDSNYLIRDHHSNHLHDPNHHLNHLYHIDQPNQSPNQFDPSFKWPVPSKSPLLQSLSPPKSPLVGRPGTSKESATLAEDREIPQSKEVGRVWHKQSTQIFPLLWGILLVLSNAASGVWRLECKSEGQIGRIAASSWQWRDQNPHVLWLTLPQKNAQLSPPNPRHHLPRLIHHAGSLSPQVEALHQSWSWPRRDEWKQ